MYFKAVSAEKKVLEFESPVLEALTQEVNLINMQQVSVWMII